MRPSVRLHRHRAAVEALCARFEADNPRVFGSVLRGADTPGSDVDLLVDTDPGNWMAPPVTALGAALAALLGVRVDVLTPADLPDAWRAGVEAGARPLADWTPVTGPLRPRIK